VYSIKVSLHVILAELFLVFGPIWIGFFFNI